MDISSVKLNIKFDVSLLKQDIETVKVYQLAKQPGLYHDGSWKGISLWNANGVVSDASASTIGIYAPTKALTKCPYIQKILYSLDFPIRVARILYLPPGNKIAEHTDAISFSIGTIRLHIPVITHNNVKFKIGGKYQQWRPGECWYGDFEQIHSVENNSNITRIHLVLDCNVTEALLRLFPRDFVNELQKQKTILYSLSEIKLPYNYIKRLEGYFVLPRFVLASWIGRPARIIPAIAPVVGFMRVKENKLMTFFPGTQIKCSWIVNFSQATIYGRPNVTLQWTNKDSIENVYLCIKGKKSEKKFRIKLLKNPPISMLIFVPIQSINLFMQTRYKKMYSLCKQLLNKNLNLE